MCSDWVTVCLFHYLRDLLHAVVTSLTAKSAEWQLSGLFECLFALWWNRIRPHLTPKRRHEIFLRLIEIPVLNLPSDGFSIYSPDSSSLQEQEFRKKRDDLSIIKGKLHWPASQKIFLKKACSVWVLWLEHSKLDFEPNVCCLCASFKTQDLKIALVVADVLDPTKSTILSHLGNNKKNALDLGRGFIRLFLFSSPFSVLSKNNDFTISAKSDWYISENLFNYKSHGFTARSSSLNETK